jgi:hypothetical protein
MAITTYPEVTKKNNTMYINAGTTYYGKVLSTTVSGATTLTSPQANTVGAQTVGSGYTKITLQNDTTLTVSASSLLSSQGNMFYAEVLNPYTTQTLTVAPSIVGAPGTYSGSGTSITVSQPFAAALALVYNNTGGVYNFTVEGTVNPSNSVSAPSLQTVTGINTVTGVLTLATALPSPLLSNQPLVFNFGTGQTLYSGSYLPFLTAPVVSTNGTAIPLGSSNSLLVNTTPVTGSSNLYLLNSSLASSYTVSTAYASRAVMTFGGSINWPSGTAPTQALAGRSIYQFYTPDAGTTIYGRQIMTGLSGL